MSAQISTTERISSYFEEKFAKHGYSPQGVDWNREDSQRIRLEQVLKILPAQGELSLNDIGCGFGSLLDLVGEDRRIDYRGFDLSGSLIEAAKAKYGEHGHRCFAPVAGIGDVPVADYSVASGVLNMKLAAPLPEWEAHVMQSVEQMADCSRKGFAFNLLTSYSDVHLQRTDLYYADPCKYFDLCKRKFSRNVALLHDYGMFDFTVLVRLN